MRDRDAEGNLLIQYNAAISFVTRNLKTVQVEKEFNTQGQLEIPEELIVDTTNFSVNENTPKDDMENFGVNETQKQILKFISENLQITAGEMAYKMKQTKRNVEYNIKSLKAKGIIERFGSDKTGGYRIKQ
jgi:predicted HTH transcriptional regulator